MEGGMTENLVIIGGGVMGLFTAYHASERFEEIVILERGRIGDPMTASFGRTRSYRCDYLDPTYARLAREAQRLWGDFELQTDTRALVRCGCMNIAKRAVTPNLEITYADLSHQILTSLGLPTDSWDDEALRHRFPILDADMARLDVDGGLVDLRSVTAALRTALAQRGVRIVEGVEVRRITRDATGVIRVGADSAQWATRALVVCAGHGTNEVLAMMDGAELDVPLTRDRPIEARYYHPPPETRDRYSDGAMPVVAYLDAGIYCHPIVDGVSDAVKIGYYHPPDLPRSTTVIDSVDAFVRECLPGLHGVPSEPVSDTDGCDYDLVADDDFVLGEIPGFTGAYVGVGWRGTGYKFAPWVGRVLAELALQQGTVYDIARFDPSRFAEGGSHDALTADTAAAAL
jgi:glycine/D-amino acid oxidase-like deaminating enzyme